MPSYWFHIAPLFSSRFFGFWCIRHLPIPIPMSSSQSSTWFLHLSHHTQQLQLHDQELFHRCRWTLPAQGKKTHQIFRTYTYLASSLFLVLSVSRSMSCSSSCHWFKCFVGMVVFCSVPLKLETALDVLLFVCFSLLYPQSSCYQLMLLLWTEKWEWKHFNQSVISIFCSIQMH